MSFIETLTKNYQFGHADTSVVIDLEYFLNRPIDEIYLFWYSIDLKFYKKTYNKYFYNVKIHMHSHIYTYFCSLYCAWMQILFKLILIMYNYRYCTFMISKWTIIATSNFIISFIVLNFYIFIIFLYLTDLRFEILFHYFEMIIYIKYF